MFSFLYCIIEGDFGAAFAGGWCVWFVVVNDTIVAIVYHLIVTLYVCGSAAAESFNVIGLFYP